MTDTSWFDYSDADELSELLEEIAAGEGDATDDDEAPATPAPTIAATPSDKWGTYEAPDVFLSAYDDQPLLIPELDIGRGRPCGIWGAPGSGKSDTALLIALAVASGRPVFGKFPVSATGRVVHFTYDMGFRATSLRYRRIANGMGLSPADVEDRLSLCVFPDHHLSDDDAAKAFARKLRGHQLAILDNARESAPDIDENDSRFGAVITTYGRAAEAAGCVPIYLHHTKKDSMAAGIGVGRGSSAITAASGCIWLVDGQGAEPRRLSQLRQHDTSDGPKAPFQLRRVPYNGPTPFDTGSHPSWRYELLEGPQRVAASTPDDVAKIVADEPGITQRELRRRLSGRNETRDEIILKTCQSGKIHSVTQDGKMAYFSGAQGGAQQ